MPVPRSEIPFCRANLAWECPLVFLAGDHPDPTDDGTFEWASNTLVCDPCYTALMEITPSGRGVDYELDEAAAILRRQAAS